MKKLLLLLLSLIIFPFLLSTLQGNDLVRLEYYFDNDPGIGNGNSIPITDAATIELDYNVDISLLNDGFHTMYVRAKDQFGYWSFISQHNFFKERIPADISPDITRLEYFIDTDPGIGSAQNIDITADSTLDITCSIDISALNNGFHTLYMRIKDEFGIWSFIHQHNFYKDNIPADLLPNIVRLEYYIDTDPGMGNATAVPITEHEVIEKNFTIDLTGLNQGMHVLYIRVKDENGNWSMVHQKHFSKESINITQPKITAIAYFFTKKNFISDTAFVSDFSPENLLETTFIADLSELDIDSTYTIHVYVVDEDNVQSLAYSHEVTILEIAGVNDPLLPQRYDLSQNYPNPFNPVTMIKFSIPELTHVILTIYNSRGQKVADILDQEFKPGYYKIPWDGAGKTSGVYYYQLQSDQFNAVKKMILLQ